MAFVEKFPGFAEVRRMAAEGVVWGAPLILVDLAARAHPETGRFFRLPADASALAPGLGAIHGDICAFSAVLDLSGGPVLISLPDTHGAYLTLVLYDGWGRILAVFGSRRNGARSRDILLVGRAWSGQADAGVSVIRAPGAHVWAVCRVLGAGEGGREDALRLQQAIALSSASGQAGEATTLDPRPSLAAAFRALTPLGVLGRLARLLPSHPPDRSDAAIAAALGRIGVVGGEPFDPDALPRELTRALTIGAAEGLSRLTLARSVSAAEPQAAEGWERLRGPSWGAPLERALGALSGLGAAPPEEVLAFTTTFDSDGRPLTGERDYCLGFEPGTAPPANGFWSLCLTDTHGRPLQAPFARLSVGDWFGLTPSHGERFEISIGAGEGAGARLRLQPPPGPFGLRFELYGPKRAALDQAWLPPPVMDRVLHGARTVSLAAARSAGPSPRRRRSGAEANVVRFLSKGASP